MKINRKNIEISNPDKIIFPGGNITKKELVNYYEKIADFMLPHMENRPIMMRRFPDGVDEDGFYMKDAPDYFPDWIERATVEKKEGGTVSHVVCNSKETLAYLANQACITPHIWLSKKGDLKHPDKMIFDLDPSADDFQGVKKAALAIKKVLDAYHLESHVMSTGSKGIHVIVPIQAKHDFETVKKAADIIARHVVDQAPDDFTTMVRKEARDNKVFIDTLRNAYGQTSVTPYALRATRDATVATPLTWKELRDKPFNPRRYHIKNIFRRLSRIEDPWKNDSHAENQMDDLLKQG